MVVRDHLRNDAEIKVHNIEHLEKLKMTRELRKKRIDQYRWTTTSRRKPETITDILIHPNTKPLLQSLSTKKKNKLVGELMTSLGKKYDRLKVITEEIGINPTLPALEQFHCLSSGRKRKALELESKVHIPGLEFNRSLSEGVQFVNNKVIEYPEQGIFFIDVFGDQAFQRISDIHKIDVDTLLSYIMMATNINTPENQRFYAVMRSMIDSHPDKEKLKSKRVKLEAIGYSLN
ncbi:hypothetical protein Tco_1148269 [Tanacetum coccineum]